MSEHPAGWYPDPRGRHEYRYWDGTVWTDHVADQGQASTDPVDVVGPAEGGTDRGSSGAAAAAAEPEQPRTEPEPAATETPATPAAAGDVEPAAASSGLWAGEDDAPSDPVADRPVEAAAPDAGAGTGALTGDDVRTAPGDGAPADAGTGATSGAGAGATAGAGASAGADAGGTGASAAGAGTHGPGASAAADAGTGGPSASATGDAGTPPRPTSAGDALRSATATKSPALAGLLTVVAPGSGHFYLGAGSKAGLAAILLVATLAAYVLSWFSFGTFVVGFLVWLAAAAFGVFDLQGVLRPIREAGAAAASISRQQVGLVLVAGGVLLVVGLILPWYHISVSVDAPRGFGFGGFGSSGSVSGFGSTSIIDIVLLLIGIAVILLGLAAMGVGPLSGQQLPTWIPTVVAAAGVVALVLVAYRLAIDPVPSTRGVGIDVKVGRGFGLLLDGAAALAIAAAGVVTLIQSPRAGTTAG